MTKIKNFFKNITNSKKKVFALALSVCVVVLSIASSSIAYFTDTDTYTNVFTSGNVNIILTGGAAGNEGIYPGKVIERDTEIENVGSEKAYIGAIITLSSSDIGAYLTKSSTPEDGKTYLGNFLTGLTSAYTIEEVKTGDTVTSFKIKIVFDAELASGNTQQVFTGMTIPSTWNNVQMESVKNLTLTVDAYAVQTDGFANAAAALHAAFPGAF